MICTGEVHKRLIPSLWGALQDIKCRIGRRDKPRVSLDEGRLHIAARLRQLIGGMCRKTLCVYIYADLQAVPFKSRLKDVLCSLIDSLPCWQSD